MMNMNLLAVVTPLSIYRKLYLDTDTVKASTKFFKTIFPSDMIFTKDDTTTRDEQV